VDHYGYFYHPDDMGWRLVGRTASPIFFFLIGFARTRTVPWTWLAFGAAITALNFWIAGSWQRTTINILFNFALLRFAVLPLVERYVLRQPVLLALLCLACILLIPSTDEILEYSTEGWLWAFLGLAHRAVLDGPAPRAFWTRVALAGVAGTTYITRESHDYGFAPMQSVLLVVLVAAVVLSLVTFRREALGWQPPGPLALALRSCGRYSLEIYGITLLAMQFHAAILPKLMGSE
jgi:hypothetical protein